jgi:hypothetical protein
MRPPLRVVRDYDVYMTSSHKFDFHGIKEIGDVIKWKDVIMTITFSMSYDIDVDDMEQDEKTIESSMLSIDMIDSMCDDEDVDISSGWYEDFLVFLKKPKVREYIKSEEESVWWEVFANHTKYDL